MWRNENQPPPITGSLSMPPVNQRKRGRLPLMSNPSETELISANQYSGSGQWDQQTCYTSQQGNMKPVASLSMAGQGYAPLPYPKKSAYARSLTWQQRPLMKQDFMSAVGHQIRGGFPSGISTSLNQPRWSSGFHNQMNMPTNSFRMPYCPQQFNPAAISPEDPGAPNQSTKWNFRSAGKSGSGTWAEVKDTSQNQITLHQQKPSRDTSLRVLTAVTEGMKHWSQYKSRIAMLFEIFATLDSAVTVAEHGAKKFLMRNGKDVVQCLYFENDQTLPRLIRGQMYRCVGNYNRETDTMTCVSVRAASLSEQRNSHEAVQASDAEMRNVVLSLNEI